MKSRTSFFNPGVAKNLLRRCWPVWAAYLAFLLLLWPIASLQRVQDYSDTLNRVNVLDYIMATIGESMVVIAFFAAIVTVMLMYSYLYNNRGCGMMNSLPLTRTTLFFTAWLTGLVPLLLCDLLAAALCLPFVAGSYLSLRILGLLLLVTLFSNIAFYGFAVFCAMLTGSILILPLVYAVLNFAVIVAEMATRFVLSKLLFGMSADGSSLSWLSPPAAMMTAWQVRETADGAVFVSGLGIVALYAAAGLVFTALALLLYRRRPMECATDTVAFPILKPLFKYCMAFGCGVLLTSLAHDALLGNQWTGLHAAGLTVLFVLIGSLIGYFSAEMLIRKTVKVFHGTWRGWLIFAAASVLVLGLTEADVLGWEKRQPKAEEIESIRLDRTEYREAESIRQILALQENIVAHKAYHETSWRERELPVVTSRMELSFELRGGKELRRSYTVCCAGAELENEASDMAEYQRVMNLPEALRYRSVSEVEVKPENVMYFEASYSYYDPETDSYYGGSVRFSPEEAVDFYQNALLSDLANNAVGRRFLYDDGKLPRETNVRLSLELYDREKVQKGSAPYEKLHEWFTITVYEDNTAILVWLREHSDREIRIGERTDFIHADY